MSIRIRLERCAKIFDGGTRALEPLDLEIGAGETLAILGPSGCGKTTLLRLIAGFGRPTKGELLLYGEHIENLPPNRRPTNMVFQHYALFPHMSVAENVAFGPRRLKRSKAEVETTVRRMLALVKLEHLADRRPAQLSGGQQQRVAVARALAPGPKVVLLDEPLSALDLKLRQAMRTELIQIQEESGVTFIFVTHDQDEALSMSDRIAVMSNGQVQQVGLPSEIYEHPANRFVASFIGDANFIGARIVRLGNGAATCDAGANTMLEVPASAGHEVGANVTLFSRPERIPLHRDGSPERGTIDGRVSSVTYLGDTTSYRIEIGDGIEIAAKESNQRDGIRHFSVGDRLRLTIGPGNLTILAQ